MNSPLEKNLKKRQRKYNIGMFKQIVLGFIGLYTYQTVEKYGVIRGLYKGSKRILRCHPWSRGGLDPA